MGRRRRNDVLKSQTLPSSPAYSISSSSSSDFEFRISCSPLKPCGGGGGGGGAVLCPADDLFYKGQLLPLQLSPRLSMVRTLILASSSSSSDSATTSSRDSSVSSADFHAFADCDSSRPSSVAEEDHDPHKRQLPHHPKKTRYFSLARFSSVFKKDPAKPRPDADHCTPGPSVKRMGASAKEVIRKYLNKVKPLCEKASHKQKMEGTTAAADAVEAGSPSQPLISNDDGVRSAKDLREVAGSTARKGNGHWGTYHSFSGNLRAPRKKSLVSSCPSSIRSSPNHSGVLSRTGEFGHSSAASSMEDLQNAIQGAIAYCKSSMVQTSEPSFGQ